MDDRHDSPVNAEQGWNTRHLSYTHKGHQPPSRAPIPAINCKLGTIDSRRAPVNGHVSAERSCALIEVCLQEDAKKRGMHGVQSNMYFVVLF